ncbi:MAG: DUF2975 domain-containing protein [Clostridiaceae bacterium]|nr:DUF2975 domain-containing protein [Clostridiaceae bacterium]
MKHPSLAIWLRIAVILIALMGAGVLALSLGGFFDYGDTNTYRYALPILAIPCYTALVIFWRVVGNIARDHSFCRENVRAMKVIGILAFTDTAAVTVLAGILLFRAVIGTRLLPLVFCVIVMGFCIGVASLALANLVDRARVIEEENDLTI